LRKVAEAQDGIQGTFLAAAGLARAELAPAHARVLPTDQFIPAAGQGTLAVECRADDVLVQALLANLHDEQTAAALAFERGIVESFAGSCLAPMGVCAEPRGLQEGKNLTQGWIVRAIVSMPDGRDSARAALLTDDPSRAGLENLHGPLVKALESRGARAILASLPQETSPK
jgi:hydroxymethylbilane synthase